MTAPAAQGAMNTWDFCFWLRGFLDGAGDELGSDEVARIKQHLEETIKKDESPAPAPVLTPAVSPCPFIPLYGAGTSAPHFRW